MEWNRTGAGDQEAAARSCRGVARSAYLSGGQNGSRVDAGALERFRGLLGGAGDNRRGELDGLVGGVLQHRDRRLCGLAQRLQHARYLLGDLAADADGLVHRVHRLRGESPTKN